MPAGSRNVRLTGTSGTLRADPSFLTGGTTRPSSITPIGPSGRDRSTPCVFGLRGDWTDPAKLNYATRDVWRAEADAMEFWVRRHAVDGFRCDMAMLVPIEFWQEAARRLRAVKPDLFLLAEAEEDYLFDRAFDASYAWRLYHLMNDVAQQKGRVDRIREYLYADREHVPTWALRLMFTSNHDENSWSGSEFARLGPAVRVMTALTFLLPQSLPLVYTGQEFGYDHSFAFFDRDPLPACEPNETTEFYRRLIALRHDAPALASGERGGSFVEIRNNAEDCLLTFVRETPENRVVALLNVSPYEVHADFDTGIYAGGYADALTGERVQLCSHVDERMPGIPQLHPALIVHNGRPCAHPVGKLGLGKDHVQLHQHPVIQVNGFPVGGGFAGQLRQDPLDLLLFL